MSEKDSAKLGWGGKRPNQNGRPKLPPEERRVYMGFRVAPETHEYFHEKVKGSQSKEVDRLVRLAKAKKKTWLNFLRNAISEDGKIGD